MLTVSSITIYSKDEEDNIYEVEGEITFDDDHTTDFSTTIDANDNIIEKVEFEFEPEQFDEEDFINFVINAEE